MLTAITAANIPIVSPAPVLGSCYVGAGVAGGVTGGVTGGVGVLNVTVCAHVAVLATPSTLKLAVATIL